MTDALTVRPYRPGDEIEINAGFNRVFGVSRGLEAWRWKFPPGLGRSTILVAEDPSGRIPIHYAAIPVTLQIDGRRVLAGQAVDVYSEHRRSLARRGPFVRFVHEFHEVFGDAGHLSLLYGFPGTRHVRLGVRLLRYCSPRDVRFFARDLRDSKAREAGVPRPFRGLRLHHGFDAPWTDRLWHRAQARYPVAVCRDATWIGRRFHDRPGVDYVHLRIEHRGRPAALAVVRVHEGVVHWAELVWEGRRAAALEALSREVCRLGRGAGADAAHLWLDGDPPARGILERCGWIARPEPRGLQRVGVPYRPSLDAADVCRRMYVTMGDADLI